MAKRKAKSSAHKDAQKPSASSKKDKDNTLLWIIGAVILIVVIILIVRSKGTVEVPEEPPVTPPTEKDVKVEPELPPVLEVQNYCREGAAIGAKPQFCERTAIGANVVVTHLGADQLEGLKYYIIDEDKNILSEGSLKGLIEGKSEGTFEIPVSEADAASIELRAIAYVNEEGYVDATGTMKECMNQRTFQPLDRCQ